MNRKLKVREIVIVFVLFVALIALLYYRFVHTWYVAQVAAYDTASIDTEIMTEQARALKLKEMEEAIEESKDRGDGVVESYNNLKAEINELNDIFADAVDWNFSFDQAQATGQAERRNITATYSAIDYESAKEMLQKLHDSKYRNLIRDLSISNTSLDKQKIRFSQKNLNEGPIQIRFTVTFYETLVGADTTDGLAVQQNTSIDGNEILSDLSASKDRAENTGI